MNVRSSFHALVLGSALLLLALPSAALAAEVRNAPRRGSRLSKRSTMTCYFSGQTGDRRRPRDRAMCMPLARPSCHGRRLTAT